MSDLFVRCTELGALPASQGIRLAVGKDFRLHLLTEQRIGALRQLSVRPATTAIIPAEARQVILTCELTPGAEFRVKQVGALPVLMEEGDDARKLWVNDQIRAGTVLTIQLRDRSVIRFALEVADVELRGLDAAVAASDWRAPPIRDREAPARWRIPDVSTTLEDPVAAAKAAWKKAVAFVGKYRTAAWMVLPYGAFAVSGYFLYRQDAAAVEAATAENASLKKQNEQLQDALKASLSSEGSCLDDNIALANALQTPDARARAAAAKALALAETRERAASEAGAIMNDPRVVARDERATDAAVDRIAGQLLAGPPLPPGALAPCVKWGEALGADLPPYILTWSAYESAVCPAAYAVTLNGVVHSGRWGLSPRFTAEFDPAVPALAAAADSDARMAWSLARGVREIRGAVLATRVAGRPPVLPGQADLWALTLADAYNQLARRADGAVDATAIACVGGLMSALQADDVPPELGAPILPDLIPIANGEPFPTPSDLSCPWALDGWSASATRALVAVARAATPPPTPAAP